MDAAPVAVISYGYWQQRFGGDPAVIGKTISVNATPVTIVGVAPAEFRGARSFGSASALSMPLVFIERVGLTAVDFTRRPGFRWMFGVMGRLKPGVTVTEAQANLATGFQQSAVDGSIATGGETVRLEDVRDEFPRLSLQPGSNGSELVRLDATQQLTVLTGLMALLLLIACTNVANLLLARGASRRKEIAVRLALGASRARLVRQLLVESLCLALSGGLLGAVFAIWGADVLAAMFAFGGVEEVAPDWRVLGFAITASTFTGVLFGLAPALRATRLDLNVEFQGGPRTVGSRPALRLAKTLMIVEVALSFVVLAGAGLFISTLRNLRAADLGFEREHRLMFGLAGRQAGYKREDIPAMFDHIAREIETLPGVRAVTFSRMAVLSGGGDFYGATVIGRHSTTGGQLPAVALNEVDHRFFGAYDLPPLLGRTLEARDGANAMKVIVINQTMARTFFPDESPLGQRLRFANLECEVVGVVRDMPYAQVREAVPPAVYLPFALRMPGYATFMVRASHPPQAMAASIRKIVQAIDANLTVVDVRTQDEHLEQLFRRERMFASLTATFGGLALILVCIGLYGLMSYAVQRRTGEFGVRMALGALPNRIVVMVLRESCGLVVAGIAFGIAGAWAATRLVANMLYGLSPTDPWTYGAVVLLLIAVALLACWLPARRAARVDPMVALRAE